MHNGIRYDNHNFQTLIPPDSYWKVALRGMAKTSGIVGDVNLIT